MIHGLKVTRMGHLPHAPAEGEVLDSVATEEIRHLLYHRWLVQVELVRASGTPTHHAEEESAHTHARTEVVHNIWLNQRNRSGENRTVGETRSTDRSHGGGWP